MFDFVLCLFCFLVVWGVRVRSVFSSLFFARERAVVQRAHALPKQGTDPDGLDSLCETKNEQTPSSLMYVCQAGKIPKSSERK